MEKRSNNFDFLRFFAASLVLFSHSFPLVQGSANTEPLIMLTHGTMSLGTVCVIVFFIISGFLITASWDNRKSFSRFLFARVLRIFPGLAVMLGLTAIACAFVTTSEFKHYFVSSVTYILKNLFLYIPQGHLSGVFDENPFKAVNGSLWTLRLEFTCYLMVAVLGVLGLFKRQLIWILWCLALAISYIPELPTTFLRTLLPLLIWFVSGMLCYFYREVKFRNYHYWLFLGVILVFVLLEINLIFLSPILAYLLCKVAYIKTPFLNFGKYGDFSYGIYIYAFPIQQLVVFCLSRQEYFQLNWWVCFFVSFPITFLCAVLSWHFVEKKFLRLKSRAVN